jgi:hypothetical protein
MDRHMRELEVCGTLMIDGNGGYCVVQSLLGASNTAEGVAEHGGRDGILYQSESQSVKIREKSDVP